MKIETYIKIKPYLLIIFCFFFNNSFGQRNYEVTVFGTDSISATELKDRYGEELDQLMELYIHSQDEYKVKRDDLNKIIIELGEFAYSNIYLLKSYTGNLDYIIDFVEMKDKDSRLNFREAIFEDLEDPDSLVDKWNKYESLSFLLFEKGEINDMDCPVIHCIWSFNHLELEPYLQLFNKSVPSHKNEIIYMLNKSDSSEYRAAASFLLAHANIEPEELLEILMPSIRDPNSRVRNNSMRVIYYIVRANPNSQLDLSKVIEALNYPSFTDRNKTLVILRSLPLDNLTEQNLNRMIPVLLEILEKKDAHNYRNAHLVLKKISEMEYLSNDINSWRAWADPYIKN